MDRLLAKSYDRMVERDKKYRCFVDGGLGKRSFLRVYTNEIYNRSELSFSEFSGQFLSKISIALIHSGKDVISGTLRSFLNYEADYSYAANIVV
ncbi:unnamed protein product [Brugia pahangi]|uniref:Recombinase n=1 Tax=Brugia pahangi TaxID=6280 RepID=A0A0N4TYX3_BRUPA|nr:unnamed protein product [Brugia pahangi]